MLFTIGIVLLILWLLGLITAHTFGGVLHVLLVIAVVMVVIRLLQGRRI
ncbi:MAG: lmo0937 family membrane protein [Candidatus Krumholzibacteriota bacterium]|nr:lmo0937 family membrane protein [Candidatus Krumholzibacteriota bacterium]